MTPEQQALSENYQQYMRQQNLSSSSTSAQQQPKNHHHHPSNSLLDPMDSFSDIFNDPSSSGADGGAGTSLSHPGGPSSWNDAQNSSTQNNQDFMAQYQSLLAMQQQQQSTGTTNISNQTSSSGQITPGTIGGKLPSASAQQHQPSSPSSNHSSNSRLFLGSKVEPFDRSSTGKQPSDDEDLLKFLEFDDEPLKLTPGASSNTTSSHQQAMVSHTPQILTRGQR